MDTTRRISLLRELSFKAIKSQGPGGQHVNKVSTSIELRFNINDSSVLTQYEKEKMISLFQPRLTGLGELILVSQGSRSQLANKEDAIDRFIGLVEWALQPVKKRRPTKPSRASVKKRIARKKLLSEKKKLRRKDNLRNRESI